MTVSPRSRNDFPTSSSPSIPPDVIINPGRADERHVLKCNVLPIKAGDVIRTMSGGGGGFGDPKDRDPELVRADVRNRHVSPAAAKAVYGVSVDG